MNQFKKKFLDVQRREGKKVSTKAFYLGKHCKCVLIIAFEDVAAFFVDHPIGMSLDL